ncbi:MAG: zinc-ribbon domain-containing protein, partial [Deltaproteobacteria bacterium]|nr:zinc-ribbon domain-containing protein [Deltaproteobacteria bacterium]
MKIVCDACAAKYSIADDKVKGKVFKIRCKKCSNIIVVRGTGPGAATDEPAPAQFDQKETRVYDYGAEGDQAGDAGGDEAVWHVVIDQEQVGPVTAAEIQRRFAGGEIDAETYIWREGFADWQPLSQIEIFAALAAGGSTTNAHPPSSGEDAVASMFGGPAADEGGTMRSDPNDLFAAAAARTADDDGADDAAGDLFGGGGKAARHAAEEPAERGGKAAAPASGDKRLRGERNENSVLFSLGNLAALASDAPRASAPAASSSSSSSSGAAAAAGAAAHGGGEGSGLIDIRSMASTYLADKGSARPGGKGAVGSVDDLPVFSTAAFSEPVVIMPTGRSGGSDKKVLYALVGVVGLLAVVAVVLIVMVMGGGKKESSGAVAVVEGSGAASGATPGSAVGGPAAGSNEGSAGSAGSAAGSNEGSAGSAG